MAKKNRSTLKRFFREGALPSEDQFGDLIDSCLNTIDEGFDKTPENGFEISLIGDHERLISFFRTAAAKDVVWSINYDKEQDRLLITKPSAETDVPPAMTFTADGRVGVKKISPDHELDVEGVVAAHGRIGGNPDRQKTISADGDWHNITGALYGCQALEIMAGVGSKGTGRYALMNATAINAFNPSGWIFNFLNLKKKIKYHQSYYLARGNRIKLRWYGEGDEYRLQMKTHCDYGEGVKIRYYITRLWFDEDMSESWAQGEEGQRSDLLDND
jgi:hypothetical protein